jgi:transcriptional regulator with XRE-family HTH domain
MDRAAELRDFLRSRRARLEPPDVGLEWRLGARRVTGLRREEVALIAGISVDYYTRLEQGRARNVSDQVLDALARALKLDDLEREHLRVLARPDSSHRPAPTRTATVSAGVQMMLDVLDPVPAVVHTSLHDLLKFNRMGAILFGNLSTLPAHQANMARWTFLDPHAREVFPDWEKIAAVTAASLRRAAAEHSDRPALNELIGELSVASADFTRMWADHKIRAPGSALKTFAHPLVGEFTLLYQDLRIPQEVDQYIAVYIAQPGSPAAEKLTLLSTWNPKPGEDERESESNDVPTPNSMDAERLPTED